MAVEIYVTARVCVKREALDFRDRLRIIHSQSGRTKKMARKRKNPYAVALGRRGGKIGGRARAANMTPEERSESARNAVLARWSKQKTNRKGSRVNA